ncbi:BaiN/RdsA family NAD(P)/FAD-dependent oxidoreductase [Frigoriflavimonas asaccharolytica]|uniref:TIGR03862 family flavoprotein n=1 Tax=Frigoriflavimonas asaccharolytica TaxID=2735899 RepID=A0A8J8G9K3_9FLAO|nr:TIGR03862 family flavoprotein [Frigoriflavimonas asaccharolytica]NRS93864.1 hypothetical protein [Frigoriflavimonas asaccharolytica]
MQNKPIIIIGAGPSGLMAAQILAESGFKVQVFEQNKAAARKFLVAGNGGFNLTHSEELESFIQKYDALEIQEIVQNFDSKKVIEWLCNIGVTTYVGSSGKIFPTKNFKPIQVLQAWLDYLKKLNVEIFYNHTFLNFDENYAYFNNNGQEFQFNYSKLILGMGGGSWNKTGSDAKWIDIFNEKNIKINPLQSANSGYNTAEYLHQLQGQYLKNVKISFNNNEKLGEIVFTKYGIEGSPVYFMNRFTRKFEFPLTLNIDLKPNLSDSEILELLKSEQRINPILKKKLKISTTGINLLKTLDKESFTNLENLAHKIKNFPIEVLSFRPIDEVISTAGGVDFSELNADLSLKKFPNTFCIGEMIDWEAPTGGYLLQACFSTGNWVAKSISKII